MVTYMLYDFVHVVMEGGLKIQGMMETSLVLSTQVNLGTMECNLRYTRMYELMPYHIGMAIWVFIVLTI